MRKRKGKKGRNGKTGKNRRGSTKYSKERGLDVEQGTASSQTDLVAHPSGIEEENSMPHDVGAESLGEGSAVLDEKSKASVAATGDLDDDNSSVSSASSGGPTALADA